ncbi:MAG TPA: hypothetical protein VGI52_02315, partial [Solirubrobacteraceae bacterium]
MSTYAAEPTSAIAITLPAALEQISQRAEQLDREPRFPRENFADLVAAGALRSAAERPGNLLGEIALVRSVAAVDASSARIL